MNNNDFGLAMGLSIVGGLICIVLFSSCAVPAILGVKSIKTAGGTEVNFITGADFRIGANGIDQVQEKRGIEPTNGYYQRPVQAQQAIKY